MADSIPGTRFPLLMYLHPFVAALEDLEPLRNFLQAACLRVNEETLRVLKRSGTFMRPFVYEGWLRLHVEAWNGPIVLFWWSGGESEDQAASKIGTLDNRVPAIRKAHKILIMEPNQMTEPHRYSKYPFLSSEGEMVQKPLFVMRAVKREGDADLFTVRRLGAFIGTRAPTGSFISFTPPKPDSTPESDDERITVIPPPLKKPSE